ncbi:TPA: hypothetical protein N0F65_002495 [Lagenidium giganteum]|uniref:U1 small nuclear ribonucleoprotein C n=1 Tax=Lagenidium giganteum TaxID=4803 RepID=A0AAV2YV07_9STRA|nr:TPA: hypothetical protein N0F65_002495 [Lagenidium giganteum]
MPRYYCDYCDTYLTHDSLFVFFLQQAGRKQHNRGWKHRENVKLYYEQFVAGQGGMMTPGEWLRGPAPMGVLPPRPGGPGGNGPPGGPPHGMFPPRGPPPRGMMPPGGPGMMRPPPFMGMGMPRGPPPRGMMPPPRPSIYGPQS